MNHKDFRDHGMTLVELLVAITITVFIVFAVNQIFNQVARTVSYGTQMGEIIQKSRGVSQQFARETETDIVGDDLTEPESWASHMVGPGDTPPGFLMIVNHTIDNVYMTTEDFQAAQASSDPSAYQHSIASDQLVFVYKPEDMSLVRSLCPDADGSYDVYDDLPSGVNARMWYGHVMQLPEGGRGTGFDPDEYELGWIYRNNTPSQGVLEDNPNKVAADWVLGRQALFMLDGTDAPVHVSDIDPDAVVSGYGGGSALYHGLTDICSRSLDNLTYDPLNGINPSLSTTDMLVKTCFLFRTQRLMTASKPIATNLESADIAPMHTYFIGGVSDFIVEFAHDYYDGVYLEPGHLDPPKQLSAPDPDGKIDCYLYSYTNNDGQLIEENRIIWYTLHAENNRWGGVPYEDDMPITFQPPLSNNKNYVSRPFPYARDGAMVWLNNQHASYDEDTGAEWPILIRIRYRLHDRNGKYIGRRYQDDQTVSQVDERGQWFEVILPVNRQSRD